MLSLALGGAPRHERQAWPHIELVDQSPVAIADQPLAVPAAPSGNLFIVSMRGAYQGGKKPP